MRILIRAVNWVGDAVMMTPALTDLKECLPDTEIAVLANSASAQVLDGHPAITEIIPLSSPQNESKIKRDVKIAAELARRRFDLSITFPLTSYRAVIVPWLARIPRRAGYKYHFREIFLTDSYRPLSSTTHLVEVYRLLVAYITGCVIRSKPKFTFTLTPGDLDFSEQFYEKNRIGTDEKIIGIVPGAAYGSAKRWPLENYLQFIKKVTPEFNVLVLWGPGEETLISEVRRHYEESTEDTTKQSHLGTVIASVAKQSRTRNRVLIAPPCTLKQLGALICRCSVVVGNDTGPLHVAAALNVPVVALFGPTDPQRSQPLAPNSKVLYSNPDCGPCYRRNCRDLKCLKNITVNQVLSEVRRII